MRWIARSGANVLRGRPPRWPDQNRLAAASFDTTLRAHLPRGGYVLTGGSYLLYMAMPSPAGIAQIRVGARFPLAAGPSFELTRHPTGQWRDPHLPAPYGDYFQLSTSSPKKSVEVLARKHLRRMLDDLDQPRLVSDGDIVTLEYADVPSYSESRLRVALDAVGQIANHDLFGTSTMLEMAGSELIAPRVSWDQRLAPSVRLRGRTEVELCVSNWRRQWVTRVRAAASDAPTLSLRLSSDPSFLPPAELGSEALDYLPRLHGGRLLANPRQVVFDFPTIETHASRLRDAVALVRALAAPRTQSAYRD